MAFKALCITKLFGDQSTHVLNEDRENEKLNQFPIKPFYHYSLWYSLQPYSHLPFLISKTFSHILPMYRFNQLVTAKTISERLLLSFNFKYTKLPILNRKFLFLFISLNIFKLSFPATSILFSIRLKYIHDWQCVLEEEWKAWM